MGELDLSAVSDATEVLLGRAEVRLESSRVWSLEVPNGSIAFDEYQTLARLETERRAYFESIKNRTALACSAFWAATLLPAILWSAAQTEDFASSDFFFIIPFLLIGCFAFGALTSFGVDEVMLRRLDTRKEIETGLPKRKAHVEVINGQIRQAWALLTHSLEGLRKLDLPVELELSLSDVEREFHLFLGRWQEATDSGVKDAALKRMARLAIQTSALYEAQGLKAQAEESRLDNALESEGVDLRGVIQSTAEEAIALLPLETFTPELGVKND